MEITVTGRHFDVTAAIKQYLEKKLSRLERFTLKLVEAHVMLTQEKYRHIAEVTLLGKRLRFTAKEVTHDMYASIDQLCDTIWLQVERYHERVKSHKTKRVVKTSTVLEAEPLATGGSVAVKPQVIRSRRMAVKPMSLEEAIDEFAMQQAKFFVFRNSERDRVNVLYRRPDGNVGLIET